MTEPTLSSHLRREASRFALFPQRASTNLYLREATRSYILGLWAGCVALARAALEYAMRERVEAVVGTAPRKLGLLIQAGERLGILDKPRSSLAMQVKLAGDRVLHRGRASESTAADALAALRGVVLHLYE